MNIRSLTNLLEANVRDEIASKREALSLIEAQEISVAKSDAEAFELAHERSKSLIQKDAHRASRRIIIMKQLGELWQVAADALTLGSVVVRLKDDGKDLAELRTELRSVVAAVIKRNRRLSALLGMHRRLNRDILQVVLGAEKGAEPTASGNLVNAEA